MLAPKYKPNKTQRQKSRKWRRRRCKRYAIKPIIGSQSLLCIQPFGRLYEFERELWEADAAKGTIMGMTT